MRLWSLHSRYLDGVGLVAVWREALLAQAVLRGSTRGYTRHSQLRRFREARNPVHAIGAYLRSICDEADARGYQFDRTRIVATEPHETIQVTSGQLDFEWAHLMDKLRLRSPEAHRRWCGVMHRDTHPLFHVIRGGIADWERAAGVDIPRSAAAAGPRAR